MISPVRDQERSHWRPESSRGRANAHDLNQSRVSRVAVGQGRRTESDLAELELHVDPWPASRREASSVERRSGMSWAEATGVGVREQLRVVYGVEDGWGIVYDATKFLSWYPRGRLGRVSPPEQGRLWRSAGLQVRVGEGLCRDARLRCEMEVVRRPCKAWADGGAPCVLAMLSAGTSSTTTSS